MSAELDGVEAALAAVQMVGPDTRQARALGAAVAAERPARVPVPADPAVLAVVRELGRRPVPGQNGADLITVIDQAIALLTQLKEMLR